MLSKGYNFNFSLSSLFMHYFAGHGDYGEHSALEITRAVFNAVPEIHFILLLAKIDATLEPALEKVFTAVHTFKSQTSEC